MFYDISIKAHLYSEIEAENLNEAKAYCIDVYYEETGDVAYTDDAKIIREYDIAC